jgi:hypothetical protein
MHRNALLAGVASAIGAAVWLAGRSPDGGNGVGGGHPDAWHAE